MSLQPSSQPLELSSLSRGGSGLIYLKYGKLSRRCAACRQTSRLHQLIKSDTESIRFYFVFACCFGKVQRIGGEQPRDDTIFFA